MKPDRVHLMCTHREVLPGGAVTPAPHSLQGVFRAEQQRLFLGGLPALAVGDVCRNESADHRRPAIGASFVAPPDGQAEIDKAGQQNVFVQGKPLATLGGLVRCCSESQPQQSCRQATCLASQPRLFINGQAVVRGQSQ